MTFDPVFPPELAGMYTCGVRNVSFADVDDVTLSITAGKRRGRGRRGRGRGERREREIGRGGEERERERRGRGRGEEGRGGEREDQ